MAFEWTQEKAIWDLSYLSQLNVLRFCDTFPVFSVFDVQLRWYIAYCIDNSFIFDGIEMLLPVFIVDKSESFLGIESQFYVAVLLSSNELILAEDDGGSSEEFALLRYWVHFVRFGQAGLLETKMPVVKSTLSLLHSNVLKLSKMI